LANIPPWIFGWRVLTLPPRISGELVKSATLITGNLASMRCYAVPPLDRIL